MQIYNVEKPELIPYKNQFIVADTNILIALLNGETAEINLLNEIKANSGIIVYTDISLGELYVINDRNHIHKKRFMLAQRKADAQDSMAKSVSDLSIITSSGAVFPHPISIESEDRVKKYEDVKNKYPLNWADAKILATTIENGMPVLWTNDCDFGYCDVPDLSIITNGTAKKNLDKAGVTTNFYIGF